jgi:hypothetical protein
MAYTPVNVTNSQSVAIASVVANSDNENVATNTTSAAVSGNRSGIDVKKEVSIWPNPSTGIFNLQLPTEWLKADLQIYDVDGKEIMSKKLDQTTLQLNLSKQVKGVYMLRLAKAGKVLNRKIVLQ